MCTTMIHITSTASHVETSFQRNTHTRYRYIIQLKLKFFKVEYGRNLVNNIFSIIFLYMVYH
jgi:hypothetical protein